MKHYLSIFLCISLLLSLTGCIHSLNKQKTVSFYYRLSEDHTEKADSLIQAEKREITGYENNTLALLNLYLSGPTSQNMVTPFPKDTILIDATLSNKSLQIRLSNRFARLTGIDLFIACACLTKTATEISGAREIVIMTESALMDGHQKITMSADSIFLSDFSSPPPGTEAILPSTEETTVPTETN